jgi:hypothetical protein
VHVRVAHQIIHQNAPQQGMHRRFAQRGLEHHHCSSREVVALVLGLGLYAQNLCKVFAVHAAGGRSRIAVVAVHREKPGAAIHIVQLVVVLGSQQCQGRKFGLNHLHASDLVQAQGKRLQLGQMRLICHR